MIRKIAVTLVLACASIARAEEPIPIESFFRLPQYAAMALSPDGKHIAALAPLNGRQGLMVIDLDTRKATPVTSAPNMDVVSVRWINSRRMLYRFATLGERDEDAQGGYFLTIDRDGENKRQLGGLPQRTLPGESDDLVLRYRRELYRLDTRTGRSVDLAFGKPDTGRSESWLVDSKGVGRVFIAYDLRETRVWYRAGPNAQWSELARFQSRSRDTWFPVAVAEDDRTLYVWSRVGRPMAAIYRYDPETKKLGELVAQHPQVDLASVIEEDGVARGVAYDADRYGVAWFDESLASIQAAIDKALPERINSLSWSTDRQRVVVFSYSDISPGSYYLYERNSGRLEWMADRQPWIKPERMSPMRAFRYKARDGREIPAYITIPRGLPGKNLPLVVMVHGGPWVHGDTWRWNAEVQFLASRGYAVLQPNYRGTTRYGWDHYAASFRQYGLAMQDDITDALKWAIDEGIADPSRACIYGASYGGYAAMMGVAKTPELFKCAINYVGVTDLTLLMTASWSDTWHSEFAMAADKFLIGDPEKDAERLNATSPTNLASRIKAPVMMAYGTSDVRVVPEHGTMMKAALERAGNPPEVWMMVDGEGHGFRRLDNQVKFYGEMEGFLARHIGPDRK